MLKATSNFLQKQNLTRPTVIIDQTRATANIQRMAAKARQAGAIFRPHFKTHQSGVVGRWFHEAGVRQITVSSLDMAEYFADLGWRDITVAVLHNPRTGQQARRLAEHLDQLGGRLGLLVDDPGVAAEIATHATVLTEIWFKIDTGYGRTGIVWNDTAKLQTTLAQCRELTRARGLLTHAGHSYHARGAAQVSKAYTQAVTRLQQARDLSEHPDLQLSFGDTPCCSLVADLSACDEIRPGNFVFNDLMQLQIGSCQTTDLAAAVACPVIGVYPERGQIVLHSGAVHLSKEYLVDDGGRQIYGLLGTASKKGLGAVINQAPVISLSQEHATVEAAAALVPGDLVVVWPVHSCLTCNLLRDQMAVPLTI